MKQPPKELASPILKTENTVGFTLTELLVVLSIVAALAVILLPVLLSVRSNARRTECLSNMRQLGMALQLYTQDNDGYFCPDDSYLGSSPWDKAIQSYVKDPAAFRCPACNVPQFYDSSELGLPLFLAKGYALNFELYNERTRIRPTITDASVLFPSSTVALCEVSYRKGSGESYSIYLQREGPDDGSDLEPGKSMVGPPGAQRHSNGSNYAFVDGHCKWYKPEQVLGSGTEKANNGEHPSFAL